MEFASNSQRNLAAILWAVAAIAATALLIWYGNGLNPWWPLPWFAPLPVLIFALRSSWRSAAVTAALGMFLGSLNMWHYFRVLHAPPVVWLTTYTIAAILFALAVLLFRALALRGAVWSALLAFPALWVSCEYLHSAVTRDGTAGSLAYSQLRFLPFLQLASITGPWGMSFVLLLFPAGIAIAWNAWKMAPGQAKRVLGATVGLVAAVLLFGAVRLEMRQPGPDVKVGLVASDMHTGVIGPGAPARQLFEEYAQQAQRLIARGARVVVMPEDLAVIVDPKAAPTDAIFQNIADNTGAVLVIGMNHISGSVRYNEARIYTPGIAVRTYHKEHLLPPFENIFTPGTSRTYFAAPGHAAGETWGVAICKDLDFTNPARAYGRAGVGLMLAPAWDFQVDAFWHGHIAVMRAVEDGFSLVRSARGGFLTVANDRGRIVAETRSNTAPFATLIAEAPVEHQATIYLLLGDWFGWLAIAALVFSLIRLCQLQVQGRR